MMIVAKLTAMLVLASRFGSAAPSKASEEFVVVAPAETLFVNTTHGTGKTVVIIPGILGGDYSFRKVIAALAHNGNRVVVVNPLGMGGSSRPRKSDYSMQAQAVRVAAALDSLNVKHAVFLAHATGVPVALRIALMHPSTVEGVVAVNGSASEHFSAGGVGLALRLSPILKLLGGKGMAERKVVSGMRDNSADQRWVTNDVVKKYTAPYQSDFDGTLRVLKSISEAKEPWPLLSRLHEVRVPVTLLLGTGAPKPQVKPEEVEAMRSAYPTLRVESVAAAGQFVQEEKPESIVSAILRLE